MVATATSFQKSASTLKNHPLTAMLWTIENTPHKIMGSTHILPEGYPFPPWVEIGATGIRRFVFESNVKELKDSKSAVGTDPSGEYSKRFPSVYRAAEKILKDAGLPSALSGLKPWMAGFAVSNSVETRGYRPEHGLDNFLHTKAAKANHQIDYLEPAARAFELFDFFSESAQGGIDHLKHAVRDVTKGKTLEQLKKSVQAWTASDLGYLESYLVEQRRKVPFMTHANFTVRNQEWASKVEEMIRGDVPTLFVVGALHTVGRDSFLASLRAQGFSCRFHSE